MVSGTLGTFPGVGTLASISIDTALTGRDIYNEVGSSNQDKPATILGSELLRKEQSSTTENKMQIDIQKAKNYSKNRQERIAQNANNATLSGLKSSIMADTLKANDKNRQRMEDLINLMNVTNLKGQTLEAKSTIDVLCQKYGNDACDLLQEAVSKPDLCIDSIGDAAVQDSSGVVQYLCNMDGSIKNKQIIQKILNNREINNRR